MHEIVLNSKKKMKIYFYINGMYCGQYIYNHLLQFN
jgi:hypothetical protein